MSVGFKKMKKDKKKNSFMAQTIPDALFRPIFITATPLIVKGNEGDSSKERRKKHIP